MTRQQYNDKTGGCCRALQMREIVEYNIARE